MKVLRNAKWYSGFCIMLSVLLVVASSSAYATKSNTVKYTTVEQIETALSNSSGTEESFEKIAKASSSSAINEFIGEILDEADALLEDMNYDIDGNMVNRNGKDYCSIEVNVDDNITVVYEFEDGEDADIFGNISGILVNNAYAADNGEILWKDYGNRYFTASKTVWYGVVGLGKIKLENHYKLSSNGIDERYGAASVSGTGLGADITPGDPIITDASARTPGSSDVNMSCAYHYRYSAGNVNSQGNFSLNTTIAYLEKNASAGQIKVRHSWN